MLPSYINYRARRVIQAYVALGRAVWKGVKKLRR